jgi:hypothetical protein
VLTPDGYGMVVAPRSETEHRLTAVWRDVVGAVPRSIDDEFLAAGGDEATALVLLDRVCERWRIAISIEEFLEASSIARLSATIERKVAEARTHDNGLLRDVLSELEGWSGALPGSEPR